MIGVVNEPTDLTTLFWDSDDSQRKVSPFGLATIGAIEPLLRYRGKSGNWNDLASRLITMDTIEVALEFGMPVRDKDLVYLPATGSSESFDKLRYSLLSAQGTLPRKHNPHITLVHPRNGTCTDNIFDEISSRCRPFSSTFRRVSLIEQVDGGQWQDLKTFE